MSNGRVQRVVIIDDHPLLRKGLQQLAEFTPAIKIVGEADNGEQGIELVRELRPDLVLLDLKMPGMNGLTALKRLKQLDPAPKVAILTVSDAQKDIMAAMRGGADGYLLKDMDPDDLSSKFQELAEGHLAIAPDTLDALALALRAEDLKAPTPDAQALTQRECEILIHISNGESNKLIARKLDIADTTVKVHVKHLLKKLGLKSRVEAAVWAVKHKNKLQ